MEEKTQFEQHMTPFDDIDLSVYNALQEFTLIQSILVKFCTQLKTLRQWNVQFSHDQYNLDETEEIVEEISHKYEHFDGDTE